MPILLTQRPHKEVNSAEFVDTASSPDQIIALWSRKHLSECSRVCAFVCLHVGVFACLLAWLVRASVGSFACVCLFVCLFVCVCFVCVCVFLPLFICLVVCVPMNAPVGCKAGLFHDDWFRKFRLEFADLLFALLFRSCSFRFLVDGKADLQNRWCTKSFG